MVNVVVILFQGCIEDVSVFRESKAAEQFFSDETRVSYEEFKLRCDTEDSETILGDYAGSNIWEVKIK